LAKSDVFRLLLFTGSSPPALVDILYVHWWTCNYAVFLTFWLGGDTCSLEEENLYLFDYRSDVTDSLGKAFDLDFTKKRLTRSEIKKNLGAVKK
jgi:hypothetical protein